MKIYFAGIPAGDGKKFDREVALYKVMKARLISYHYIANVVNIEWSAVVEVMTNEDYRDICEH
jgi:hypothetical protein